MIRAAQQVKKPGTGLRRPTGRTWADIAVLLILTAIAVIGFEPSFGGYGFLLAGLGGLVLGAATGILTSVFRVGPITTVLIALTLFFLCGTPLAVPAQATFGVFPSLQSLASIAIGSVYGWSDIITLATPIGAPQYIAVVPYVAAWVVALLSTTLATRWLCVRPRTPWRFGVALIAPIALYVAGILLGTDEPYQAGLRGIVFGVLTIIWLGWRGQGALAAQAGAAKLRNRKIAGTAVIVMTSILVGGAAAYFTAPSKDERFVLREAVRPPFDPLDYPSPLSGFRHYTKQATDAVLFTVQGLQVGDVIRLTTLDSFTGKLWNVTGPESDASGSGSFELVGRALPKPKFITPTARTNVTFTIATYNDVWIPGIGYPTSLRFTAGDAATESDSLRYNPATGTAVLTTGLHTGDSYVMNAEVQKVFTPSDLGDAKIASVSLPPVEGSPDIVTAKAQEFVGSAKKPIEQLEAIRLALVNKGFLSHGRASDSVPSSAGHGADRITELLERTQMVGDQEQYASAFALMARSLGYPARVVMGFAPAITEGKSTVAVTGNDVTAWVEVAFDGVGWVAFNPTPKATDVPQAEVPKPQSEPQPQVRQPPRAANPNDTLLSPVELQKTDKNEHGAFIFPAWVWGVGLGTLIPATILFVPMLIIGGIKARRMRRRRTATAGHDRVAGAWAELVDRYSELGYAVPKKSTRLIAATSLEQQAAAEQPLALRTLAATADEAVFSGADIDEQRSATVWTEVLVAANLARATVTRTRRIVSRYRIRMARRHTATEPPRTGNKS